MAKNICPHNDGVRCPEAGRRCQVCGWSSEGNKRRRNPSKRTLTEGQSERIQHRTPHCRIVAKVNAAGRVLEVYPSIVQAAQANNMSAQSVKNYLRSKVKNPFKCTGGYTFQYAD